jgi:hypothetical protein
MMRCRQPLAIALARDLMLLQRARHALPLRIRGAVDALASWSAALRSRTAGSEDKSPCRAIHEQRPYHCRFAASTIASETTTSC